MKNLTTYYGKVLHQPPRHQTLLPSSQCTINSGAVRNTPSIMKNSIVTIILGLCLLETLIFAAETSTKVPESPKVTSTGIPASVLGEGRDGRRMELSDAQLQNALKDKRYLMRQLKCTLGEAPCDPVGRRLKTLAPLVLRGSCPQCSPTEMRQIQMTLLHIQKNFPKEWAKIIRTYQ